MRPSVPADQSVTGSPLSRTTTVVTALVLAAAVGLGRAASADAASGRFVVGAAAADITPPLAANAASNPANCDPSGFYDGPHLFSLQEPYKDLNGHGRYDN